ncbi:MAG: hypothetical protein M3256_27260, partial [Actinomycetota bacterium]|nr:hypothetical protein [Actinomycetota bacterium]
MSQYGRIAEAPPGPRQKAGPHTATARPHRSVWSIPELIGVTQAKSVNGSLTIPYPAGTRAGDHLLVFGTVGPSEVGGIDNYYGFDNGLPAPVASPSAYPYAKYIITGWPGPAFSSSWTPDQAFPPVSPASYDAQPWYADGGRNGMYNPTFNRVFTGDVDPEFTLTATPATAMHLYMVCTRGGIGGFGFPQRGDIGFYFKFWYNTTHDDPGGINHVADYPFSLAQTPIFVEGRFALLATTVVLKDTVEGSTYPHPHFPNVSWTDPVFTPEFYTPTYSYDPLNL